MCDLILIRQNRCIQLQSMPSKNIIQGFIKNVRFPYGHLPIVDVDKHHDGNPSNLSYISNGSLTTLGYLIVASAFRLTQCVRLATHLSLTAVKFFTWALVWKQMIGLPSDSQQIKIASAFPYGIRVLPTS